MSGRGGPHVSVGKKEVRGLLRRGSDARAHGSVVRGLDRAPVAVCAEDHAGALSMRHVKGEELRMWQHHLWARPVADRARH